ncbi:hypothetical protein P355_4088 [Burkholderia cenocepacia KC-01]|nr:hypothetical protein P355_4088 [Burkholderia cenocepacia KC-01]
MKSCSTHRLISCRPELALQRLLRPHACGRSERALRRRPRARAFQSDRGRAAALAPG